MRHIRIWVASSDFFSDCSLARFSFCLVDSVSTPCCSVCICASNASYSAWVASSDFFSDCSLARFSFCLVDSVSTPCCSVCISASNPSYSACVAYSDFFSDCSFLKILSVWLIQFRHLAVLFVSVPVMRHIQLGLTGDLLSLPKALVIVQIAVYYQFQ